MYTVQIQTPPTGECVSSDDLKAWLRLSTADEDSLLAGMISTARMVFEAVTQRIVLATGFRQYNQHLNGPITLMRGQVTAISAVKYYDGQDTLTTWSNYQTDLTGIPARIWLPTGASYPLTSANIRPVVYTDFTAGWATANSVPEAIKTGIKLLAAHYFQNREAFAERQPLPVPYGFKALCSLWGTGLYGSWEHRHWHSPWELWQATAAGDYQYGGGFGWF